MFVALPDDIILRSILRKKNYPPIVLGFFLCGAVV
jgi:hypothetical protein